MKALVIDDDMVINEAMVKVLRNEFPFETVVSAADGHKALLSFEGIDFDLIVLDINIPKLSGLKLLKLFRDEEHDCGIIMVSAGFDAHSAQIASDFSVDEMLAKPFDMKMFSDKVQKYMNTSKKSSIAV